MAQKNYTAQLHERGSRLTLKFTFNYRTKTGSFSCNELEPYPVYDGLCIFFPLEGKPDNWLLREWNKATSGLRNIDLYRGRKTVISFNKKYSYMSDVYCPICLEQKSEYEGHHCVARSDGGKDGYQNVLQICNSCHAHITSGCFEERWPKEQAALYHQIMYFDYEVYPREFRKFNFPGYEHDYIQKSNTESLIREFELASTESKLSKQITMQKAGRYFYQYFRDIGMGIRHWKKEFKLFPNIYNGYKKDYEWIKMP